MQKLLVGHEIFVLPLVTKMTCYWDLGLTDQLLGLNWTVSTGSPALCGSRVGDVGASGIGSKEEHCMCAACPGYNI